MNLENIKSTTTWAEASGTMNNNNAKITEAIERLESAVEEGSGGVADSVAWVNITGKPDFASVATSGKYSDLSGTPTTLKNPTALTFGSKTYDGSVEMTITASDLGALTSHQDISHLLSITEASSTYQEKITSSNKLAYSLISGTPSLASVATSGKYDDLIGKPTLLSSFTDDVVAGKYLLLSGGTIKSDSNTPLVVDSNHETETYIRILRNGASQSLFGYKDNVGTWVRDSQVNKNIVISTDGELRYGNELDLKKVWHEGNFDPLTYKAPSAVSADSADTLNGLSSDNFARYLNNTTVDANTISNGIWGGKGYASTNMPLGYYAFLSVGTDKYKMQFNSGGNILYFRSGDEAGLEVQPWKQIAFIDSNVASATKAEQDSSGNVITSTYATKTELDNKTDEDGVFIMFHRNSDNFPLMVKPEKWKSYQDSGEIAEGVVIVEGGRMLVVATTETSLYWSGAAVSGGGKTTTDRQLALIDFEGKANTKQQITHAECSGENYAPGYCALYSKVNANGRGLDAGKWWLPSMGELMMIYANRDKINYALSFISGATQLAETWYWSSTEYSAARAWDLHLSNGYESGTVRTSYQRRVRPVSLFYETENTTIMPWSDIVSSPNLSEFTSQLTNVASAVFAQSADLAVEANLLKGNRGQSNIVNGFSVGHIRYDYIIDPNTEGMFSASNWASALLTIGRHDNSFSQLGFNANGWIYYRVNKNDQGFTDADTWKRIAFVDTKVDAAAVADKLQTPRKIWGQDFDGSGNIQGHMYGTAVDKPYNEWNIYRDNEPIFRVADAGLVISPYNKSEGFIALRTGENTDTSGAKELRILKSGNVLIGKTIASGYKLDVNGDAYINGNILTTGGVTMNSQSSLKNVVDERGLSLDELSVIKPTRFTWKDGRDNRLHIGGIADDVMEVMPEVVYKGADGVLSMDYASAAFAIGASLIKPVNEHERKIAELQDRVRELEDEVETLKNGSYGYN